MEGKKSVILYIDVISTFESLDDAEAGRLIKHYLRYVNDLNPEPPDKITQIAFEPIKQQLKRDLALWNNVRSKRSEIGHIGGIKSGEIRRKIKESKQNEAKASKTKQTQANEAVTVNVTVNDTVNVKENSLSVFSEEQQRLWGILEKFIFDDAPQLLKFKEPITPQQYFMLRDKFETHEIEKTMRDLDNYKGAAQKYISVYKTLNKWIKMAKERTIKA